MTEIRTQKIHDLRQRIERRRRHMTENTESENSKEDTGP